MSDVQECLVDTKNCLADQLSLVDTKNFFANQLSSVDTKNFFADQMSLIDTNWYWYDIYVTSKTTQENLIVPNTWDMICPLKGLPY